MSAVNNEEPVRKAILVIATGHEQVNPPPERAPSRYLREWLGYDEPAQQQLKRRLPHWVKGNLEPDEIDTGDDARENAGRNRALIVLAPAPDETG